MQTRIEFLLDEEDAAVLERAARWLGIEYPVFTEQETAEAPPLVADLAKASNEAHGLTNALLARSIYIKQDFFFRLIASYERLYRRLAEEVKPDTWVDMSDSPTSRALVDAVIQSRHPALQDVEAALDMLAEVCNTTTVGKG